MGNARDWGGIATPVGTVSVTVGADRLVNVRIGDGAPRRGSMAVNAALDQIDQWFAGERRTFDLPLAAAATPRGGMLRHAIAAIGFGETATYGALARRATSSARAIGQACARNPFPLIVPCHRVLAAGDRLGFYSAGAGSATKRWLLDFEAGVTRLL